MRIGSLVTTGQKGDKYFIGVVVALWHGQTEDRPSEAQVLWNDGERHWETIDFLEVICK